MYGPVMVSTLVQSITVALCVLQFDKYAEWLILSVNPAGASANYDLPSKMHTTAFSQTR